MVGLFFLVPVLYFCVILMVITFSIRIMIKQSVFGNSFSRGLLFFFEIVFTIIAPAIGFIRFDQYGPEMPFSKPHVASVILLVVFSSACFWIAKVEGKRLRGAFKVIVSGGIMLGIILCAITTVHFGGYNFNGLAFPIFGFELLSPFVCIFILLKELVLLYTNVPKVEKNEDHHQTLDAPLKDEDPQVRANTWGLVASAILPALLIFIAFIIIDVLSGQGYDAMVRAYTESSGFIFSEHY